jgi:hypothetical protein
MEVTTVGERLSVGADMSPDATAGYDLVVLVSDDHQHVGEKYPSGVEVLRCPLCDMDEPPSVAEIKRAQAAAEEVAWTVNPWKVPLDVWRKHDKPFTKGLRAPMSPEEGTALVTCEAGENRSLWVAGMALTLTGEQPSGKCARMYLEKLRGPTAFHNSYMRKLLDDYYPESLKGIRPAHPPPGGFVLR